MLTTQNLLVLKYVSQLYALIVKTGWYFYTLEAMKKIVIIFVLDIDAGLFCGSTLEKMDIHHGENEEEKWKKWKKNQKELHMPKETHVPNPDIFLSPKILYPSPGDACLVF